MIRIAIMLGLTAIVGLIGFFIGRADRAEDYRERRISLIRGAAIQSGAGQLLVIGDSIVELQQLPSLCGRIAINGGISGARVPDLIRFSARAIRETRPARVVFAVGVNDLLRAPDLDPGAWTTQAQALLATWPGAPIVVGITAAPELEASKVARMNAVLRKLTVARGGQFVAALAPKETDDGIHPSLAGASAWQSRVNAACRALGRRRVSPR